MEANPDTAGYVAHITIGTPTTTLTHIIGVYMPSDKPAARKAAYTYIENQTQQCNGTSHTLLVAGDWNATLHPTDMSEGNHNTADQQHANKCMDMQLKSISGPAREHTYHCYEHHALQHSSRIDDIYIFPPQPAAHAQSNAKK